MKVSLRPLWPAKDLEMVVACQADLYGHNFPRGRISPEFLSGQRRWILGHLRSAEPNGFIVAEHEQQIVGFAWGRVLDNPLEGREGYVMQNYVLPDWRRQGIGRQLLDALEQFFVEQGAVKLVLNVTLSNTVALALYRKAGFAPARYEMEKCLGSGVPHDGED